MRATSTKTERGFEAKAISGIHTILVALNCPDASRKGLKGFAFEREMVGPNSKGPKFLRSQKVFKSVVPDPKNAHDPNNPSKPAAFYTDKFPVQSFLWGDYAAAPNKYRFRILPMFGTPGALTTDPKDEIRLEITTETEWEPGETHGVWFNRGAIAGQKFAEEFGNKPPAGHQQPGRPDGQMALARPARGLPGIHQRDQAGRRAARRGLRVHLCADPQSVQGPDRQGHRRADRLSRHRKLGGSNEKPMEAAGLPINDQKITYRRSKTKIPHNKFIVRLKNGTDPVEVWTGSTNFTPSGFLGQTNVGHRVADAETARQYFEFWKLVKTDPDIKTLRAALATLTPDPAEVIKEKSVARLFSPRAKSEMLGWYGRRMLNAANSVWFTAAFGISKELVEPIAQKRNQMRFVLMEKPTTQDQKKTLTTDFNRVILSYGVPLGQIYRMKDGKPTSRMPIKEFELDKWFFKEEHFRPKNDGFVFFVHTKFLLIDPLSDDPLVCSGSANFSSGSLLQNDENMLLVRGNTRVADIYMTEFDRIFRHFYFRDIANELAAAKTSDDAKAIFLDETDAWSDSYFKAGTLKSNRRLMFFDTSPATWFANAAKDAAATPDKPTKPAKPPRRRVAKKASKKKTAKKKTAKKKTARRRRLRRRPRRPRRRRRRRRR